MKPTILLQPPGPTFSITIYWRYFKFQPTRAVAQHRAAQRPFTTLSSPVVTVRTRWQHTVAHAVALRVSGSHDRGGRGERGTIGTVSS